MGLTDLEKEIILAYAECDMNQDKAGKKVFKHRNTIEFHFKKIKKSTGLNPKKFYDLVKLVEMVKDD